jgi:D-alanine-D-alanine ligase
MAPPRVLILYNEPVLPLDHPDAESERNILDQVDFVRGALAAAGFTVSRLGVGPNPTTLASRVRRKRPDVLFNLFEGLAVGGCTEAATEAAAAGMLEWLDLPFTGSPAATLALARDKGRTKHLLRGAGLPTPAFFVVERLPCPPCPLAWPAIVKPACLDASVGIEQASVVTSQEQLESRVAHVLGRYGLPALVEQFVRGREFHVYLIEEIDPDTGSRSLRMLPPGEILFLERGPGYWPLYTYDAKWNTDTRDFRITPLKLPATLDPGQLERLERVAAAAFRLVGCRDYAGVDVRMTAGGKFMVLDVNPNPDVQSRSLCRGLEVIGRPPEQFVVDVVRSALSRGGADRPEGAAVNEQELPSPAG